MKFNTYPLLFVFFAVIASANPFDKTELNLMKKRDDCPITSTDSCCYDNDGGCYRDVAGYAWGTYCAPGEEKRKPVGIKCDNNAKVPISPLFGIDGDNPGNFHWRWTELCGGDNGCDCCKETNRGGAYEWANWCEPKWEKRERQNKTIYCFKYIDCDFNCCMENESSRSPGCFYNPWESCADSIRTYCWARCDTDAPCKKQ
ncbi:hypothetical protein Glove_64g61 [Diversispora epigaea]|uniref:Uncharacterized protein n=1 Tax=Diversispora epigaea TaxID=1348612 RepID=A0A397JK44_9GLOM|nr:hypothetical protein Glove_64g61 [Diversispora epigaea]